MVSVFILATAVLALTRVYGFKTSVVDLGAYTQIFWNYSQRGEWLHTVAPPFVEQHAYGYHFTPFFHLIYPFFALFPQAEFFQLIQSLLFGLSTIPLFYAVLALGWEKRSACFWVACFLLNPFTLNAAVWEFHETALSTFAMSCLLWACVVRKRLWMLLSCLLLLSCKEHFGIAVAAAGLLWTRRTGEKQFGIVLFAIGICCVLILLGFIIPSYSATGSLPMMDVAPLDQYGTTMDRFGWIRDPLAHKEVVLRLAESALSYFGILLLPFLCLPLLAPIWMLPAAADFLVNSLSTTDLLRSPVSYHSAPIIPVLMIAAAVGSLRLRAIKIPLPRIAQVVCGISGIFGWILGPLPLPGALDKWELGSVRLSYSAFDTRAIAEINALLTPKTHLSAQNNIGSIFAKRRYLYMFPYKYDRIDAVVLRLEFPYQLKFRSHDEQLQHDTYRYLIVQPEWGVAYWNAPWLLLQRGAARDINTLAQIDDAWKHYLDNSKVRHAAEQ